MRCPCKQCERRHVGCHSMCSAYQGWKKELEKAAKAKDAKKQSEPEIGRQMVRKMWRKMRWK